MTKTETNDQQKFCSYYEYILTFFKRQVTHIDSDRKQSPEVFI